MSISNIVILITIFAYMAMMLVIGLAVSKKNKTTDDFYLGGRGLGPLVTAMSAEASDMSGWLLMGLPAVAMMGGLAEASWTAIGLAIGTYVNWLIVARRLRLYSEKLDAFTLPDFFAKRFGDKKSVITCISALMIVVFFVPYVASGFSACGKLFSSLFGMDYVLAMVISAVVIILYCTFGGFFAASVTDFIQSIIMTVALLVVLGFSEGIIGGFDKVFANVRELPGYLDLFKGYAVESVSSGSETSYGFLKIVSTLSWGLGYFGMPHILLRFMAINDDSKLKLSRRVASVWVVISMGVAVLIGVVGYSLMKGGILPEYANATVAETIIVDIAGVISRYGYIPAFVGGIILSGILASTMSTADSQLLAAASSVSQNLVQETFKVKLSAKTSMLLARLTVVAISIIAIFIAADENSSVFHIVSFAWAGFGATFGPAVLCALFWKRANKQGIVTGMVGGGVMVFLWKFVIAKLGGAFAIYELLPAFVFALVLSVVVSLCTKAPDADITSAYDELKTDMKA